MKKHLIYIVEDDEDIRELVLYALRGAGFSAVGFERGEALFECLKSAAAAAPDLLLLDIMLPGPDGFEILKQLRQTREYRLLPVVMLTAKGAEYDKVKALDAGADDYIVKPFGITEMLSRVRAILRRTGNADAPDGGEAAAADAPAKPALSCGRITLDLTSYTVTASDNSVSLTLKEFELLRCFMQNQGRALTRDKLLDAVWGIDFAAETRTVDMHIKTLRRKLGEYGAYIKTIRGVGYKLEVSL